MFDWTARIRSRGHGPRVDPTAPGGRREPGRYSRSASSGRWTATRRPRSPGSSQCRVGRGRCGPSSGPRRRRAPCLVEAATGDVRAAAPSPVATGCAASTGRRAGAGRSNSTEGQPLSGSQRGSKSTRSGPAAVNLAPRTSLARAHARRRDPRVSARSCPDFVAIRVCLETNPRIRARKAF